MDGSGFENILVDVSPVNMVPSVPSLVWDKSLNSLSCFVKYRSLPKKSLGSQPALPFFYSLIIGNKNAYFKNKYVESFYSS